MTVLLLKDREADVADAGDEGAGWDHALPILVPIFRSRAKGPLQHFVLTEAPISRKAEETGCRQFRETPESLPFLQLFS